MNELINKDNEWIIHFMGSLDRLLDNYERLNRQLPPALGGERFFTDKEVSAQVEGKSKNTSRLPQRRTDSLYPIRWQNPLP